MIDDQAFGEGDDRVTAFAAASDACFLAAHRGDLDEVFQRLGAVAVRDEGLVAQLIGFWSSLLADFAPHADHINGSFIPSPGIDPARVLEPPIFHAGSEPDRHPSTVPSRTSERTEPANRSVSEEWDTLLRGTGEVPKVIAVHNLLVAGVTHDQDLRGTILVAVDSWSLHDQIELALHLLDALTLNLPRAALPSHYAIVQGWLSAVTDRLDASPRLVVTLARIVATQWYRHLPPERLVTCAIDQVNSELPSAAQRRQAASIFAFACAEIWRAGDDLSGPGRADGCAHSDPNSLPSDADRLRVIGLRAIELAIAGREDELTTEIDMGAPDSTSMLLLLLFLARRLGLEVLHAVPGLASAT